MHVIQTYGEMEAWFHSFFSLALDGGEWPSTWIGRFTPEESRSGGCGNVQFYTFQDSTHSSVVQSVACTAWMSFPTRHVKWKQPSVWTCTMFQH